MRQLVQWLGVVALLVWAQVAEGAFGFKTRTKAELLLSATSAKPGDTITAGIRLTMDPGWHVYWRYGGDSGIPTVIEWTTPAGVQAKPVDWALPEKYLYSSEYTYVYHGQVILTTPITIAADARPGEVEIKAKVDWLECEKSCVPGGAELVAKLTIGSSTSPSPEAALLEEARGKAPKTDGSLKASAQWAGEAKDGVRPLVIEFAELGQGLNYDFFPYGAEDSSVQAATEKLEAPPGVVRLRKIVKSEEGKWPTTITGVIVSGKDPNKPEAGTEVSFNLGAPVAAAAASTTPATSGGPAPGPAKSIWLMLGFAFVGGLILNVMPCVLPVIALKILGFVNQSKADPAQVRKLGLIYGAGVLASFLVLAGIVIAVKQAGDVASWGMQFQNTQFVVVLTVLVTLVSLNLFGLFEITLGGGALNAASDLAAKEGPTGAFFNGVLATALATPCTAPFLGAALGFAFAQSPAVILLFFMMVGAGLAAPYVVLSWHPAWLKSLPKPGAWMEKFKVAMGFPMLATAIWLFSLAASRFGKSGPLWLGLFLVVVALTAWVWGEFVQRGASRHGLAIAVAAALLIGGYAYILEGQLRWRSPVVASASTGDGDVIKESPDGVPWRRWTAAAVEKARKEGKVVLVDFTADWCLTCKVNKKTSIEIAGTRAKLEALGAVALLGDFTAKDPLIYAELQKYGRAGVPLVLVYPARLDAAPIVLPEILTPGIVQEALDQAAKDSGKASTKIEQNRVPGV